jgi:hypothetical protein
VALVAWRLAWHKYVDSMLLLYAILVFTEHGYLLRVGLDGDEYWRESNLTGAYA